MPKYNDFELDVQSLKVEKPEEEVLALATGMLKTICICPIDK